MKYNKTRNETFQKALKIGSECEERVRELLKILNYSVMNISALMLPVDLLVWNNQETFWVQVKYRSKNRSDWTMRPCPIWIKIIEYAQVSEESQLPIVLVIEYCGKFFGKNLIGETRLKLNPIPWEVETLDEDPIGKHISYPFPNIEYR